MIRDPYYRKILEGLEGPLDPHVFEACVVDLLRAAYPALVPIHGGSDAGMDGAIADGEGEAYPLLVTTSPQVARNLDKSLSSYARHGGQRRQAVLATSQALTPQRRRSLEERARERHNFTLVNIHDRHDLARRLYRSSRWVRNLLGIPGDPPALSAVPQTHGTFRETELLGRDADLKWLRQTRDDRLVVGQPGSGKTALLLELVRGGKALFLASNDEEAIANAYRDLEPAVVLVDDAHADPDKLARLRQIREDIGADFEIVASTWPGAEADVAAALGGLPQSGIRRLELLTRKEIIEVLRAVGVSLPDDDPYLRLLVDQAANKPGLAVTLGSLWLRGEWPDVLTGKALQRSLIPTLKRVLEHDPTELLACFALGGDRGMSLEAVGTVLGLGRAELRRQAVRASQGGVLTVHRDDSLSVHPELLRFALVGEVFFTPPRLCSYRELLDLAPDRGQAVETLALAAARRVAVPRDELRSLLLEAGTSEAWQAFAALGDDEARWVLEHFPGSTREIAGSLLDALPRPMIRRLLREAESSEGPLHSQPSHPLRLLQDWVQEIPETQHGRSQTEEVLHRRVLVVEVAKSYLDEGGDQTVGLRACFSALSPELESTRWTATGAGLTLRKGALPASAAREIRKLWEATREGIHELTPEAWGEMQNSLRSLSNATVPGKNLSEKDAATWKELTQEIVADLVSLSKDHPGLLRSLKSWVWRLGMHMGIELDKSFETLFPFTEHLTTNNRRDEEERQERSANDLAIRWAQRKPEEVAERLDRYMRETRDFGGHKSLATWTFFRTLAREVKSPEAWLKALLGRKLDAGWVAPLLERVTADRRPGWEKILRQCFESGSYAWLAAEVALCTAGLPKNLLETALAQVPYASVEHASQRGKVPLETLKLLFQSPREEIVLAAVTGEWTAEPERTIRPELAPEWKKAFLGLGAEGRIESSLKATQSFWLENILRTSPDLAEAWLKARIETAQRRELVSPHGVYAAAVAPLPGSSRQELLGQLQEGGFADRLIPLLVGDSVELYKVLLTQIHLRRHHLAPLAGKVPDAAWVEMAELALEAGRNPRKIAEIAFHFEGAIGGSGIDHWSKWKQAFEALLEASDGKLREVAEEGLAIAVGKVSEAEQWKRHHELTGGWF